MLPCLSSRIARGRVCASAHIPPPQLPYDAATLVLHGRACSREEVALRQSPDGSHLSMLFLLVLMLHQNIRVQPYEGQESFPPNGSVSHLSHLTLNSGWRFYHSKYKSLWWVSTQKPLGNEWRPMFIIIDSKWESSFFFSILKVFFI